ncbi:CubicO group peptidase (beta-lactamase class C family) [Murinocardiopsis flavida]|uniref:CubicO group peptidase (Beta-lactamase class C family) n=1 Tax=Murinocardiopsis flavida TaxID=645275 RepID=A0A2P8CJ91_9ACTN|nr:serine hydrolase domain-containing protein [Murinocardiopsis flavida]PSK85013.1 CubicO group peptidase (beta-lactamase class C family) [Murinocardiopsis flavida]
MQTRNLALAAALCGFALAAPAPAAAAGGAPAAPAEIDAYMTRSLERSGLPGAAVAITRGDEVVHTAGYGRGSGGAPLTARTPMAIGSLSKSVTSLAVAQLVDDGLLGFDDPVRDHLPEFRLADPRADRITVRMLLTQTSGMADPGFPEMRRPQPRDLKGAVARLASARLVADPGTRWNYHNPNYHVAARLVEVVADRPFAEHLRTRVFGPAGMDQTATRDTAAQRPGGLRDGYTPAFVKMAARPPLDHFVNGSGGVVSTADDLAQWLIVQGDGTATDGTRLVSAAGLAEMHAPGPAGGDYGMGWDLDRTGGRIARIHHGGTLFTASAEQILLPGAEGRDDYGVAVAFNSASALGAEQMAVIEGLVALVRGERPDLPVPATAYADLGLTGLGAVTLGVGGYRIARARRWARRRAHRPLPLLLLSLAPRLVPVALFLALPALAGLLFGGRDVTWEAAFYGWPLFVAWAALAALLSTVLLAARAVRLSDVRRARPD